MKEYCTEVLLGFPVVNLFDGQHHAVDSSDMAFRQGNAFGTRDGDSLVDRGFDYPADIRIAAQFADRLSSCRRDTRHGANADELHPHSNIDLVGKVRVQSGAVAGVLEALACLLYTSPSPRDLSTSRMPSSA